eukprot:Lankesteria_metandrocarpae@DN5203_c0_g1_i4.p1
MDSVLQFLPTKLIPFLDTNMVFRLLLTCKQCYHMTYTNVSVLLEHCWNNHFRRLDMDKYDNTFKLQFFSRVSCKEQLLLMKAPFVIRAINGGSKDNTTTAEERVSFCAESSSQSNSSDTTDNSTVTAIKVVGYNFTFFINEKRGEVLQMNTKSSECLRDAYTGMQQRKFFFDDLPFYGQPESRFCYKTGRWKFWESGSE